MSAELAGVLGALAALLSAYLGWRSLRNTIHNEVRAKAQEQANLTGQMQAELHESSREMQRDLREEIARLRRQHAEDMTSLREQYAEERALMQADLDACEQRGAMTDALMKRMWNAFVSLGIDLSDDRFKAM